MSYRILTIPFALIALMAVSLMGAGTVFAQDSPIETIAKKVIFYEGINYNKRVEESFNYDRQELIRETNCDRNKIISEWRQDVDHLLHDAELKFNPQDYPLCNEQGIWANNTNWFEAIFAPFFKKNKNTDDQKISKEMFKIRGFDYSAYYAYLKAFDENIKFLRQLLARIETFQEKHEATAIAKAEH